MKYVAGAFIAVSVGLLSSSAYAQNEHAGHEGMTGGFIGRDGSIHDHWGGSEGPRGEPGGGGHGDGGGRGRNSGGGAVSPANQPTVPVTLNGETFNVTPATRDDLKEFLATYQTNGAIGQTVAAAASLFYAFGLVSELSTPLTFSVDDAVVHLSAPSIFSFAWRGLALGYIRSHITDHALTPHHQQEMRMWQRLQDIIRNPERYKEGIRTDENGKVIMRALPGERYRDRAIAGTISEFDKMHLSLLHSALRQNPRAMDYLATAEFITGDYETMDGAPALGMRDYILLNKALLRLDPNWKSQLQYAFSVTASDPRSNDLLWLRLRSYLYNESWTNLPMAGIVQVLVQDSDDWNLTDEDPNYDDGFWNYVEAANAPWYQVRYYPGPYVPGQSWQYSAYWGAQRWYY